MKNILLPLILTFAFNACQNDDNYNADNYNAEIEKLPTATQIGANTIGCLVNGKALGPYGSTTSSCKYGDGYYFTIEFEEKKNDVLRRTLAIYTYNHHLEVGQVYKIKESGNDSDFAQYLTYDYHFNNNIYTTSSTCKGELKITHYDNGIVSGTFWFDAISSEGKKVAVREGRFDMHITN